ncbi:MAG: chromosomal replication initiator protein DnaA [Alphaproteobacteria bacterium]|nr:chromosomal replication initiator protein DnaA [Alphaproteobacteria bacterium]MDE2011567.1 chromosomal replication initiator protein DnaA [Alphaproteobacteria bacterium]MDE2071913.1 chromosomal replication initiator protein DnaA [Alphaproteobacteria bacterium]MDE2352002.1 chromosomal replication initiator protein DnaA [Alphaproteobacteria bacterium]
MAQITSKALSPDWQAVWAGAREKLRRDLGDAVFEAWIAPLSLVSAEGGEVCIGAPKPFARNWVANHYTGRIERALCASGGEPASLSIVLAPASVGGGLTEEDRALSIPVTYSRSPGLEPELRAPRPMPDAPGQRRSLSNRIVYPSQSFDTFVAGPATEFAYRAARALAVGETDDIGLLFVHGGFGYGKTHLLNATALEARARGSRVLFLAAEDFMRQFLGALHRKDTLAFKDELRAADVLLIDDLQHICRSSVTSAEFLHTVNAFADQRRRVVIAADRAPTALDGLGADVRSRLSGGLVIGLGKPDRATRLAILKARAEEFTRQRPEAILPLEMLEHIADLEDASPRDLIGIFTKLATYADLTKKPVTFEVVEETMGHRGLSAHKTSIEDIQRKTAEFYKLDMHDFQSPQRTRRVARPRQVAMYLARELTMRSLPEIGKRFGGRDHTTVLHACRRIAALCDEDPLFKEEVEFLKQVLSRRGEA